ncbi:MAG: twin-arginine translocation signal domain-containing protein [Limisphaerales bacterium]
MKISNETAGAEPFPPSTRRDFLQKVTKSVLGGGLLIGGVGLPTAALAGGGCTHCARIISLVKKNAILGEKGLDRMSPIW